MFNLRVGEATVGMTQYEREDLKKTLFVLFYVFVVMPTAVIGSMMLLAELVDPPIPAEKPTIPQPPRTPSWTEICMAYGYDQHACEHIPQPHSP